MLIMWLAGWLAGWLAHHQSQIDRSFQDVLGDSPPPREVERLCSALDKQREGLQFLTDILA
jgi:hypothetical protein